MADASSAAGAARAAPPDADPAAETERRQIRAAQRDPRLFAALYEAHFERVHAYIRRRVRNRHDAQDLTAEVFHQALAHIGRYEDRGLPFSAWLFRIAANAIVDRAKRAARAGAAPAAEPPAAEPSAEEIEDRVRLFRLVERLPADQRRVVRLRFAEQQPIRRIAEILGRSEGAVKQLQLRALASLRKLLERDHDEA